MLLASQGFRRWATAFPLTRPIARRRARALFDLCAGFTYSQILAACVQLQIFQRLASGSRTAADLAPELGLTAEAATRLLDAAASLRLVSKRRETYALGPLGAAALGDPGIAAMVAHHAVLYPDLADPVALLRGTRPGGLAHYWPYAAAPDPGSLSGDRVAAYSALMTASQPFIADEILAAYPVGRHRHLLDIGGGEGTFLMAALHRAPQLRGTLLDLPAVAERAATRLSEGGFGNRATALGTDFAQALPTGADLITLVRVAHDHDDATTNALFSRIRAALSAAAEPGTLLVAEPLAGTPGVDAYFALYLLAMGTGRLRTKAELTAMLTAAGFDRVREAPTRLPLLTRVLIATVNPR